MPLCDMDDYTTLDGQNICGQILFIIQGTFYSTPFLMNWSGRGLVMDDQHGRVELNSAHHQKGTTKQTLGFTT